MRISVNKLKTDWNRLKQEDKLCIIGLVFLACGGFAEFAYLKWIEPLTGLSGCSFYRLFHLYCPGCGGTRAMMALLRGDILTSVYYHPAVLYSAGVFGWFLLGNLLAHLHIPGIRGIRFHNWYLYGLLALLAANCILRNILYLGFGIQLI